MRAAGLLFIVLLFNPRYALANPYSIYGFSPRAIAMGNAFGGVGGDVGNVYYNPAGLTDLPNNVFFFSPLWNFPRYSLGNGKGSGDSNLAPSLISESIERNSELLDQAEGPDIRSGTNIGLAMRPGDRIGFGVALYLPGRPKGRHFLDFNVIQYRFFDSYTPFDLQDSRMNRLVVLPAAGIRILHGLSVGAGVSILGDATSSFVTTIPLDENREVRIVSDLDIPPTAAPFAGLLYRPGENISLGLVYREELKLNVEAQANTEVGIGFGSLQFPVWLPLRIEAVTHFSPRQIVLGYSQKVGPSWFAAADLTWSNWNRYIPPFPKITGIDPEAFTEIPEWMQPELPYIPPVESSGFKNTLAPRAGVEWSPSSSFALRSGIEYEPTPAPSQPATSNILDSDRLTLAGGASWRVDPEPVLRYPLRMDLFIRYSRLRSRSYEKQLEQLRDEDDGTTGTQTSNPGYPGLSYSGWSLTTGFSAALEF